MTLIVTIIPQCDRCMETFADWGNGLRNPTKAKLHAHMIAAGWKKRPEGDVCEQCIKNEKGES